MKLRPDLSTAIHRPVLPADDDVPVLRRAEPGHQRALQPRPALDRQGGADLRQVDRASATRSISAPRPSSSSSTTCAGPPRPHNTGYSFDSTELPANTGKVYDEGNMGHRPGPKGGYFPVNPVDSAQDLRGEMLAVMGELGMEPEKHHHEVAPAQHELGLKFADLLTMADRLQLYKYVIHNVAAAYGKTATFMAKPYFGDNGSGMHVPPVDLERAASRCSPATNTPAFQTLASTTSAASSSTPRRSTPSPTRPPTPTSAWSPATRPRSSWPTRPATARPRSASPTCRAPRASASRSASRTRWATPTSPSPPC